MSKSSPSINWYDLIQSDTGWPSKFPQALGRERTEALHRLKDIVDQQKDEAALNECLARLHDIDAKTATHRQRLQETMGADLSPWQRGRLVLFLDQFESDIRQMLREAHERHNGRPFEGAGMPPAPGMGPQGFGHGPMQPGPNGMRPPQPPQGPPQTPPPPPPAPAQ